MGKRDSFKPLKCNYYTDGKNVFLECFRTFRYVMCYVVTPVNKVIVSGELKRFKRHWFKPYISSGLHKLYAMSEKEK